MRGSIFTRGPACGRGGRLAPYLCLVLALVGSERAGRAEGDVVADRVVDELQQERVEQGLVRLERRSELDAVARERVLAIAALPHAERLSYAEPVGDQLREAGVARFQSVSAHVDMVRGYSRPEKGILKSWRQYRNQWGHVLDPEYTAIGAATHRADDGWVVFVAVLVADMHVPEDPRPVEVAVLDAVNDVRARSGLPELVEMPELSAVARTHSEDMLKRGFVGHVNPDGDDVDYRVRRAGIAFRKVGENVHMSRGAKDPVQFAVEQWLGSLHHREAIMDPSYTFTGAGVAIAADGSMYFTQLFLAPERPR